jgi:hypothetical protein
MMWLIIGVIAALAAVLWLAPFGAARSARGILSARVLERRLRRLSRHVQVPPDGAPSSDEDRRAFAEALRVYALDAGPDAIAAEKKAVEAARARGGAR